MKPAPPVTTASIPLSWTASAHARGILGLQCLQCDRLLFVGTGPAASQGSSSSKVGSPTPAGRRLLQEGLGRAGTGGGAAGAGGDEASGKGRTRDPCGGPVPCRASRRAE